MSNTKSTPSQRPTQPRKSTSPKNAAPLRATADWAELEHDIETLLDETVPEGPASTRQRPDPALAVAYEMLRAALDSAPGAREAARQNGVFIALRLPSDAWSSLLTLAWRYVVHDGRGSRTHNADQIPSAGEGPRWFECWLGQRRDGSGREMPVELGKLAQCRVSGITALAILVGDSTIPATLAPLIDIHITVGPPTTAVLAAALGSLHMESDMRDMPDDAVLAEATPTLLRMAWRRGMGATAYGDTLRQLLAAAKVAATPPVRTDVPLDSLDNLAGMEAAVAWGRALARDLVAYQQGKLPWSAVDRGATLAGPPGTGKTRFARALAGSCGLPLLASSFSAWDSTSKDGHLSGLQKAMRASFAEARARAPVVLFIDELDSVPARGRSQTHDEYWAPVVNCLLECLDGTTDREGVIVIAATNHIGKVDPAVLRAGRLDRVLSIALPDEVGIAKVLRQALGETLAPGADLSAVALRGLGGTGADCERWARGAQRRARDAERLVLPSDLLAEVGGNETAPEMQQLVALHEAGHSVAWCVLQPGALRYVSIRPRGTAGAGRTAAAMPAMMATANSLQDRLMILLAGRAAEEVLLGAVSSGGGGGENSDLAQATTLCVAAETALGLGDSLIWLGPPEAPPDRISLLLASRPGLSARIEKRLRDAYDEACALMRRESAAVSVVAERLMAAGTLRGAEVESLVAIHRGERAL